MTDSPVPPPVPADDAIRRIFAHRIDEHRLSPGLVVGITEAGRHRVVARGSAVGTGRPLGADTLFEVGSVTKLFTALLLADMAQRGEVMPDEPVAALLPSGQRIPERNGRAITLRDLVTHRSGLPHQPSNVEPVHWRDPGNRYTAGHLHAFLDGHDLARTPGDVPSYSNVGFALLGHALSRRGGLPYGDLLRSRILAPLGMTATTVDAPPRPGEGAARGHDDALDPVPDCIFGALAGAGALRSNAAEMLLFLDALRDPAASPLGGAVARLTAPPDDGGLGLGAPHPDAGPALSHLGRTTGFRSSAGCIPGWDRGVVVLANADNDVAADLAAHLLDARTGLSWFRAEVTVDPGVLEGLAGRYRLGPSEVFEVTPSGGRLRVRLTGQPAFRVFAASERHYFYRCVGAQLTFEPGEDGRAARLVLHQNGRDRIAERIASMFDPVRKQTSEAKTGNDRR